MPRGANRTRWIRFPAWAQFTTHSQLEAAVLQVLPPITHKHLQNEAAVSLRTKAEQPDKRLMWWRSSQQGPRLSLPVDVRSCISSVAICTPDNLITLSFEKPHVLTNFSPEKWKQIWDEQDSQNVVPPWSGTSSYRLACCLLLSSRQPKIMEEKTEEAIFFLGNFSVRAPQSLRQVLKQPGHYYSSTPSTQSWYSSVRGSLTYVPLIYTDILVRHCAVFQNPDAKSTNVQFQGVPQRQVATVIVSIIMHRFLAWIKFFWGNWGSYHEGVPRRATSTKHYLVDCLENYN